MMNRTLLLRDVVQTMRPEYRAPDPIDLHALVRAKLTSGALPHGAPIRLLAGQSHARHVCMVCDRPIEQGTLGYEPEFATGGTLVFHKHCFNVWYEERARFDPLS